MSETYVVGTRLAQARDHVASAVRALEVDTGAAGQLYAGVDGAMRLSSALAEMITTLASRAPLLLRHTHPGILDELQADLRAMRGCLVTGQRLLEPARADLHQLIATEHGATPPGAGSQAEAADGGGQYRDTRARAETDPPEKARGPRPVPGHDRVGP